MSSSTGSKRKRERHLVIGAKTLIATQSCGKPECLNKDILYSTRLLSPTAIFFLVLLVEPKDFQSGDRAQQTERYITKTESVEHLCTS